MANSAGTTQAFLLVNCMDDGMEQSMFRTSFLRRVGVAFQHARLQGRDDLAKELEGLHMVCLMAMDHVWETANEHDEVLQSIELRLGKRLSRHMGSAGHSQDAY
jgi:hypothetical protein